MSSVAETMAGALLRGGVRKVAPLEKPFVLKSGRQSWFFYDFGALCDPEEFAIVIRCYVDKILELQPENFDFIFGPAYKGIALGSAISLLLWEEHQIKLPFCYNRKELKDHGEGGVLVGYSPKPGDCAIVIDDVVTDGLAKTESKNLLEHFDVVYSLVLVGVDRSLPGELAALEERLGARVVAITTHEDMKPFLEFPEYVKQSPFF